MLIWMPRGWRSALFWTCWVQAMSGGLCSFQCLAGGVQHSSLFHLFCSPIMRVATAIVVLGVLALVSGSNVNETRKILGVNGVRFSPSFHLMRPMVYANETRGPFTAIQYRTKVGLFSMVQDSETGKFVSMAEPVITSVSPSWVPLAGGVITLTGTNMDAHCGAYTYVQIGTKTPTGLVAICQPTYVTVYMYPVASNSGGMQPVYLAWGGGAYTELIDSCEFRTPTLTSVTGSIDALSGGRITVTGSNWASTSGGCFFNYVSVQFGVASTSWIACESTYMIAALPPGQASGATTYVSWGTSGWYIALITSFSYQNIPTPITTGYPLCLIAAGGDCWYVHATNLATDWTKYTSVVITDHSDHVYTYAASSSWTISPPFIAATNAGGFDGMTDTYWIELHWPNGVISIEDVYFDNLQTNCNYCN